jgi:hypothetical protein
LVIFILEEGESMRMAQRDADLKMAVNLKRSVIAPI